MGSRANVFKNEIMHIYVDIYGVFGIEDKHKIHETKII